MHSTFIPDIRQVHGAEMKCNGYIHNLRDIWTDYGEASNIVVRWCRDCGAVVIDEDCDGRTNPGSVRSMRFPIMTYPNQGREELKAWRPTWYDRLARVGKLLCS